MRQDSWLTLRVGRTMLEAVWAVALAAVDAALL